MRIAGAEVIICSPGRNFSTLKLARGAGINGLGDATRHGRDLAVASDPPPRMATRARC